MVLGLKGQKLKVKVRVRVVVQQYSVGCNSMNAFLVSEASISLKLKMCE